MSLGSQPAPDVTRLLIAWKEGDRAALDALTPHVYQELRRIAASYLRNERPGHTLQPTALIHEAYLRLIDQSLPQFNSRTHFFGVAAQIMRQILVDFARSHRAEKRGGGLPHVDLTEATLVDRGDAERSMRLLDLNDALDRLATFDNRKARVIELRYFGGLQREEVAEVLGVSLATVKRDLSLGEAWLKRELRN